MDEADKGRLMTTTGVEWVSAAQTNTSNSPVTLPNIQNAPIWGFNYT